MFKQTINNTGNNLPQFSQEALDALLPILRLEVQKSFNTLYLTQKEVLTLEEAAIYMQKSRSDLYKLTSSKAIRHSKPGGKTIFFKRTDLEDWMLSNTVETLETIKKSAIKDLKR